MERMGSLNNRRNYSYVEQVRETMEEETDDNYTESANPQITIEAVENLDSYMRFTDGGQEDNEMMLSSAAPDSNRQVAQSQLSSNQTIQSTNYH